MSFQLRGFASRLNRQTRAVRLYDLASFFGCPECDSAHVVAVEITLGEHPRGHLRNLRGCLTTTSGSSMLKINQQIRDVFFEPTVVVVANRFAKEMLVFTDRGGSKTIGYVEFVGS